MKWTREEINASRFIDSTSISKNTVNYIKLNSNNSYQHELSKFLICWELLKKGNKFYTEARLKTGGICDVLDCTDSVIYEILHSETEEMLQKKTKNYPDYFLIQGVKAKDVIKNIKDVII